MKTFLKSLIIAVFAITVGINAIYAEDLNNEIVCIEADNSSVKNEVPSEAMTSWVIGTVKNFSFSSGGGTQFYYNLLGGTSYLAVVNNSGSYALEVTIDGHTFVGDDNHVPPGGSKSFSGTSTTTHVLVEISSLVGYSGSGTFVANSK